MTAEIRLYITEGEVEDYRVFLERLKQSGLKWMPSTPRDADAVIVLAGLWGSQRDEIMGAVVLHAGHLSP
ncbi:MAG TPA: hypothetical protein PLM42_07225 [Methanothermobacter thermautotrophicus]|nr:hypothetical protein [Methanothermobacter thermautotrophicus]